MKSARPEQCAPPSDNPLDAARTLTIEEGSVFLFATILAPGLGVAQRLLHDRPELDESAIRFRRHPELTLAIEHAESSKIFGAWSRMDALVAENGESRVEVRLKSNPPALRTTGAPLVLTLEDRHLSRTIVLAGLNVELHGVSVDEVIGLIQSAIADGQRSDGSTIAAIATEVCGVPRGTVGEALAPLRSAILQRLRHAHSKRIPLRRGKLLASEGSTSWCCEIRYMNGARMANDVLEDPGLAQSLYGLLHGDEGWRFAPADHVREVLGRTWGSRDYVAVLAQPSGVVVLNLDERRARDRMEATMRSRRLTGLTMPHLNLGDVRLAGFDHGAIFAIERTLLRLFAARELESRLFVASKPQAVAEGTGASLPRVLHGFRFAPALFRVLYRGPESRFYKDLLKVSGPSVSELADLQLFMDERLGATCLLQRLNHAAGLVDIELRDRRATTLNVAVIALTSVATAIAAIQFFR